MDGEHVEYNILSRVQHRTTGDSYPMSISLDLAVQSASRLNMRHDRSHHRIA